MEHLTWQLVVVIIGGLTSFLAFLYAMLTKKNPSSENKIPFPWTSDVEKNKNIIDKNNAVIEEQIISLRRDIDDLKKYVDTGDIRTRETFEKFESKIEKLTNVIIEHMHNDNSYNK